MKFNDCDVFKVGEDILFETISDGGVVIYNNDNKETSLLNSTGGMIFSLSLKLNYKELKEKVINKFVSDTTPENEIIDDLDYLLEKLVFQKILIKI